MSHVNGGAGRTLRAGAARGMTRGLGQSTPRGPGESTLTPRSPRAHCAWRGSPQMSNELESWDFAEGDEIAPGRRAVSLLGGGYRYEAWLAWDEHIRALVVAKVVRPDQTEDPVARRTLAREAAMLDRLAHPLLVRSFGSDPHGARPHLLLEFVEGPRLSTLIRRFGLILEQAVPLALNLCSVLHYLAEEGVVHLDVKPRNIIMAGSPRLIDLSVARGVDELGSLGGPIGTDPYMAPEQCDPDRRGCRRPSHQSSGPCCCRAWSRGRGTGLGPVSSGTRSSRSSPPCRPRRSGASGPARSS